jgi:hypothetical protein
MSRAIALFALVLAACRPPSDLLVVEARTRADALQGELRGELEAALASGGPTNAVDACRLAAPRIAEELSKDDWVVARTSLRTRNPKNAPDAWERATLEAFEDRLAKGEDVATIEHHEFVSEDGGRVFRYMRAIPTGGLCLGCHGDPTTFDADLREVLTEHYPEDQATGFAPGQLRGAFSLVHRDPAT